MLHYNAVHAQISVNINTPASVLTGLEVALKPVFEDVGHNKELGSWYAIRLVGLSDPYKLELGIVWECNHKGARPGVPSPRLCNLRVYLQAQHWHHAWECDHKDALLSFVLS